MAECIVKWFFEGEGPSQLGTAFVDHKDLPAVALLRLLADKHCP